MLEGVEPTVLVEVPSPPLWAAPPSGALLSGPPPSPVALFVELQAAAKRTPRSTSAGLRTLMKTSMRLTVARLGGRVRYIGPVLAINSSRVMRPSHVAVTNGRRRAVTDLADRQGSPRGIVPKDVTRIGAGSCSAPCRAIRSRRAPPPRRRGREGGRHSGADSTEEAR